ncbi:HTH_XRE domain containing protein [uncultured Caudovirales phage]|uniref:HTH_XRE domain containing protein n=1 Tax=uncultured Caudovirales phage TaxID=2100421 RepID=A0A6J5KWT1_9CAUD|nr:HTH_XRE domain containing protein [uncultured Caudovirales phage]
MDTIVVSPHAIPSWNETSRGRYQYGRGMHESIFPNRIRELRLARGWSAEHLGQVVGMAGPTVTRLETGARRLKLDQARKFAAAFGVDLREVAPAEMAIEDEGEVRPDVPPMVPAPLEDGVEFAGQPYSALPVYTTQVSAGPGFLNAEHPEPEDWHLFAMAALRNVTRARPEDLAMVRVSGESMAPTLYNNDLILVDRSVRRMQGDGLYIIATGDEVQVKKVSRDFRTKTLVVASDNPAWPTVRDVPEENLPILGRVVWLSRNVGG